MKRKKDVLICDISLVSSSQMLEAKVAGIKSAWHLRNDHVTPKY